jgi:hypothetical protein
MRDALAERLLAKVMSWSAADVARERPILQALASLKYDEYQQFSPGMRFVESLALWLAQFEADERQIAYDFIRSRLIFLSEREMAHFAAVMYPDLIRPLLLERAADQDSVPSYHVGRIAQGTTFRLLQASTLFFGLSDGARVDQFRRSNRELLHEQIFSGYELPQERVAELRKWLCTSQQVSSVPAIILLDDFAGSGTSYVRRDGNELNGKITKFLKRITEEAEWKGLVSFPTTTIVVALYVATSQAIKHIEDLAPDLKTRFGAIIRVLPMQLLDERIRISATSDEPFIRLVDRYYDTSEENEHTQKGGTNVKFGFAACGLPLVLHHNAPNNSLFLLWVENSEQIRPLFQRFSRHRRES